MKSYFSLVQTSAFLLTVPTVQLVDKSWDLCKTRVIEQLPDHIRCCDISLLIVSPDLLYSPNWASPQPFVVQMNQKSC